MTSIGARLKALREERGLSQDDLARLFGFKDRQTVSAIETGERRLSAEELVLAVEKLGATLDYFTDPFRLVGENLFYSQRPVGTALDAFLAWLRSPPHRRLMFLPSFSDAGTAVFKLRSFSGTARVELWILELAQRR